MDCSLPGSSVHGVSQARILEWVAISFSKINKYLLSNSLGGNAYLVCIDTKSMCVYIYIVYIIIYYRQIDDRIVKQMRQNAKW